MIDNLTEWGQEIIPTHPLSKTECGLIRSREGCQFGKNWNGFKNERFTTRGSSQKQREILAKYKGEPFTVIALYAYYSEARHEFAYDTILLKHVTDENKFPLCDHLWIKAPRYVPRGIKPGDQIRVRGRVNEYVRLDGSNDFTLFVYNLKKGDFN
jgi:hypothetical protein